MCHYSELVDWEAFNEQLVAGDDQETDSGATQAREEPAGADLDASEPLESVAPSTDD